MKLFKLLVFGLLLTCISYGQVLKFQSGTTLSKLDWIIGSIDFKPYDETLIGYSLFAGIDYFDHTYFNLSSNVGYLRKGGKGEITFITETGEPIDSKIEKAKLDYFSINTTIDLKYPIKNKIIPYISFGPRFDYLVSFSNDFEGLDKMDALKKYNFGLNIGGGIKYDLTKIQIGMRADYYLSFVKIADWPAQTGNLGGNVDDKTLIINITIGYKLK